MTPLRIFIGVIHFTSTCGEQFSTVQTVASITASIAVLATTAKGDGVFEVIIRYLMYLTGLSVCLSLSANGSEPGVHR